MAQRRLFIVALGLTCLALLVQAGPLVAAATHDAAPMTRDLVVRADDCEAFNEVVARPAGRGEMWEAVFSASHEIAGLVTLICEFAGHPCGGVVGLIQVSLSVIYRLWFIYKIRQATRGARPVRSFEDLASNVGLTLAARGIEYGTIDATPTLAARSSDDVQAETVRITGLRANASSEFLSDHLLSMRDDGVGFITIKPSVAEGLDKRAAQHGPGFKIAYEIAGDSNPDVDESAFELLAKGVGDDWYHRIQRDEHLGDYIGHIQAGPGNRINFRIIAESGDFDEGAYEDVYICGSA